MPSKSATGAKPEDWIPLAARIIAKPEETPNLMQRCIVGVMEGGSVDGSGLEEKFRGAVAICASGLRKSGRLDDRAPLDVMKLTQVGRKRDRERMRQKDQAKKRTAFAVLIRRLQRSRKDLEAQLRAKQQ